jgi:hypothetical protein
MNGSDDASDHLSGGTVLDDSPDGLGENTTYNI